MACGRMCRGRCTSASTASIRAKVISRTLRPRALSPRTLKTTGLLVLSDELCFVVPSRGRPESVDKLIAAWEATGARAHLLFGLDSDDPTLEEYERELERQARPEVSWEINPRLRMIGTLNLLAVDAADRFAAIGFMGDDHRPRSVGWDVRFAECLSGGTGIAYGNDLLQGEALPTAVVMTSDIIETLGYMSPPCLVHMCADIAWLEWGRGIDRITYFSDVIIEHMHPGIGKAKVDTSYLDSNSAERVFSDRAAYLNYRDNGEFADDLVKLKSLL